MPVPRLHSRAKELTTVIQDLKAHGVVGSRVVHHTLQDALDQGWLVARENPKVLPGQVSQASAVITGKFHQEGSATVEGRSPL